MTRVVLVLLCGGMATSAWAQDASHVSANERAVRELVQRYVDARERRDAPALAALFTPDADQFTTSGEWRRGRDGVVTGGLASSAQNPGTRTITVESVRFVAPGVALADGGYALSDAATEGDTRRMWTTIVAVRTSAGWRIAAIRNALPQRR